MKEVISAPGIVSGRMTRYSEAIRAISPVPGSLAMSIEDTGTLSERMRRLREALRLYWVGGAGYRLRPWKSPYFLWRLETLLGPQSANPGPIKFFVLLWQERSRLYSYLGWVAERRAAQQKL